MAQRILVADDDPDILQFIRVNLELEGFQVSEARDGREAIESVMKEPPDLVLLDVMMPKLDGFDVLRRLRTHPSAANTSVILLTARTMPEDRVRGLDLGADDYINKPFDVEELVARVKAVMRRSQTMRDVSPLTGLPGNFRISEEMERRVAERGPIAIVHADLDNFKSFNDHYGFMRGDQVIKYTAHALLEAAAENEDPRVFVGHIGGDDFVALIHPDSVEAFCKATIRIFDEGILDFYDTADALRGYVEVSDRRGEQHAYPIISISLGVATNRHRAITSQWEASAVAVEMKEFAKATSGSAYEIDRRTS
ncbi:MAG: response regulator [Gammaproteobacteria bacterium]|nr:response regulator [Gammaproteobacteria bacterium]